MKKSANVPCGSRRDPHLFEFIAGKRSVKFRFLEAAAKGVTLISLTASSASELVLNPMSSFLTRSFAKGDMQKTIDEIFQGSPVIFSATQGKVIRQHGYES